MRLNMPHAVQELNYKDPFKLSEGITLLTQIEVREQQV